MGEYSRPEVFHCVKLGDETEIGLPCFAFVIFKEPKCPSAKQQQTQDHPLVLLLALNANVK